MSTGRRFAAKLFCWIAMSGIAAVGCNPRPERPSLIYKLDSSTAGWVVIVFNRPGAPPLPKSGDNAYVVAVPESGVLVTSTEQLVGRAAHDEFRVRYPDGSEKPLGDGPVRARRTGWRKSGGGIPMEYEIFFLGSAEELREAEGDERVISRVYADVMLDHGPRNPDGP